MHQVQRSWVQSQHPSTQWNLRGSRWNSAEYSTFPVTLHKTYSTLIKLHCVEGPANNKLLLTTVEPLLGRTADDEVEMPAVFKLLDATMGKGEICYLKLSYKLITFKELVDQISFNLSLARNPRSSKCPLPPWKKERCSTFLWAGCCEWFSHGFPLSVDVLEI